MGKITSVKVFSALRLVALCFMFMSLHSCFLRGGERVIPLPAEASAPFSDFWAVVVNPYAAYVTEAGGPKIAAHGRMGDIERVTGKKIIAEKNKTLVWYQFEKGWMPQSAITVYDNRLKAETAVKKLQER